MTDLDVKLGSEIILLVHVVDRHGFDKRNNNGEKIKSRQISATITSFSSIEVYSKGVNIGLKRLLSLACRKCVAVLRTDTGNNSLENIDGHRATFISGAGQVSTAYYKKVTKPS